jgi:hypothetical protein
MVLMSVITCPHCGHAAIERMPSNACRIFYDCRGCGVRLKPKNRRLLCVLFLRLGPLSAGPGQTDRCAAVTPSTRRRCSSRILVGDERKRIEADVIARSARQVLPLAIGIVW